MPKALLRSKNAARGITEPNLNLHYTAIVTKTFWYEHKHRQVEQQTIIEHEYSTTKLHPPNF